jgi:hypothetical protein
VPPSFFFWHRPCYFNNSKRLIKGGVHPKTPMIGLPSIIEQLKLEAISSLDLVNRQVAGGYASDLLSCAMRGAKKDFLWVTLQSHVNVVAVASLLNLAGVIITEGNRPSPETIAQAEKEKVILLLTSNDTFSVVGQLNLLGIKGE